MVSIVQQLNCSNSSSPVKLGVSKLPCVGRILNTFTVHKIHRHPYKMDPHANAHQRHTYRAVKIRVKRIKV